LECELLASPPRPRRDSPSFASSRAGTTHIAGTRPSASAHPSPSNATRPMRLESQAGNRLLNRGNSTPGRPWPLEPGTHAEATTPVNCTVGATTELAPLATVRRSSGERRSGCARCSRASLFAMRREGAFSAPSWSVHGATPNYSSHTSRK
jgi:hypothetical protein